MQLSSGPQVFHKNSNGNWGIYLHIPLLHWKPKHSSFEHDIKLANSLLSALNDMETISQNNAYTQTFHYFNAPLTVKCFLAAEAGSQI